MRYLAFLFFVAFHVAAEKPEVILPKTKEIRPIVWYAEQATLWKQEVSFDKKDVNAWLNYYSASKFSLSGQQELDRIINEMEVSIPDSYEYLLAKGWNEGLSDQGYADIKKAYQLHPERSDTYGMMILYAEAHQDRTTRIEFSKKFYASGQVAKSLINYHFNVLKSVEPFGVLFTEGESITIPIYLLQDVFNIGNEVTVLNLDLLVNADYRDRKFQSANLKFSKPQLLANGDNAPLFCSQLPVDNEDKIFYYALTLSKEKIAPIKDNLYVVGLASQFHQTRFDNLLLIERNLENRFLMDYLKMDFDMENEFGAGKVLSSNYFVPMLLLRDFYVSNSDYKGELQTDPKYVFLDPLIMDRNNPYYEELFKLQFGMMSISAIERQRALVTRLYNRAISERYSAFDPESKAHEVVVRQVKDNLYAGESEVTNEMYNRFLVYLIKNNLTELYDRYKVDLSQYSEPGLSFMKNYSTARIATKKEKYFTRYPVVSITYEAAIAYCEWLTEQYNADPEHKFKKVKFTLPTIKQAQIAALGYKEFQSWEIDENMVKVVVPTDPAADFAKGDEKTINVKEGEILYPWFISYNYRNKVLNRRGCSLGNFKFPESQPSCVLAPKNTTADGWYMMAPTTSYFPNSMGLFDVVGNVAEMTIEKGKATGGSWNQAPEESTIKSVSEYDRPDTSVGFRVFMEVIEQ